MALDFDAFDFTDEADPLEQTSPLQAQEPENCGVRFSLSPQLLYLRHAPQIREPPTLNHQALDLLRLALLEELGCVETQGVKGLALQSQVDRIGANLAVEN